MFPEKTRFWGRCKNASALLSSTCVFFSISKIRNLFTFESALRGGEASDGHAEGRAAGVVHANLGAELHGARLTTMLTGGLSPCEQNA